ncbi:MAG TPA: hypothetical protein VNT81_11920 [Vicinamibacterales bacterium]|nr:hypothetical protein [Vicinamibacterales bacterium]
MGPTSERAVDKVEAEQAGLLPTHSSVDESVSGQQPIIAVVLLIVAAVFLAAGLLFVPRELVGIAFLFIALAAMAAARMWQANSDTHRLLRAVGRLTSRPLKGRARARLHETQKLQDRRE